MRWGVIGVGDVTEVKAAPAVLRAAGAEVVHVMRRDAARAEDFARRHGVRRWSSDVDAVLEDPDVDVVHVATPTSSHAELTLRALGAGKHVLVEKPMAMSADECRAMVDAADAAGVRLWVAYYRRALPRFQRIRDLLPALGDVRTVQTTWSKPGEPGGWRWDPARNRGGEFFETACHTLDILDWLLGPASDARGTFAQAGRAVAASYRFGDAAASGAWAFGTATAREETVITGSQGTLSFATFTTSPIRVATAAGVEEYQVDDPRGVHGPLVASIEAELAGRGECPSTGRSALRTAEVFEAIVP